MNLKRVLDDYYRKKLKVHGLSVSDRKLSEEEIEEFCKEIWLIGLDLKTINEILETIEEYQNNPDSTNL